MTEQYTLHITLLLACYLYNIIVLSFYQKYISPYYHALGHAFFGNSFACRFTPTCSEYAKESISRYGIITGTKLAILRFLRCQPFGKGGHDPIPLNKIK